MKQKNHEVLYVSEPIDEMTLQNIEKYSDKIISDVGREETTLSDDEKKEKDAKNVMEQQKETSSKKKDDDEYGDYGDDDFDVSEEFIE